jgi:hypothetical protein
MFGLGWIEIIIVGIVGLMLMGGVIILVVALGSRGKGDR